MKIKLHPPSKNKLENIARQAKKDPLFQCLIDSFKKKTDFVLKYIHDIYVVDLIIFSLKNNFMVIESTDRQIIQKCYDSYDSYDFLMNKTSFQSILKNYLQLTSPKNKNYRFNKKWSYSARKLIRKCYILKKELNDSVIRHMDDSITSSSELTNKYDGFDFIFTPDKIKNLFDKMNYGMSLIKNSNNLKKEDLEELLNITNESYARTVYATLDNHVKSFVMISTQFSFIFIVKIIYFLFHNKRNDELSSNINITDEVYKYMLLYADKYYHGTFLNINKINEFCYLFYDFTDEHKLYSNLMSAERKEKMELLIYNRNKLMHLNQNIYSEFMWNEEVNVNYFTGVIELFELLYILANSRFDGDEEAYFFSFEKIAIKLMENKKLVYSISQNRICFYDYPCEFFHFKFD